MNEKSLKERRFSAFLNHFTHISTISSNLKMTITLVHSYTLVLDIFELS